MNSDDERRRQITDGRRRVHKEKAFVVHTKAVPHWWLHALDPLKVGAAESVRSEWRAERSDATVFDSNMYSDQVARRSPSFAVDGVSPTRPYQVLRITKEQS